MSILNSVALGIGWVVLAACFLVGVSATWWGLGELVWRLIPERWRVAQKLAVPQPRYGDYIPPYVSQPEPAVGAAQPARRSRSCWCFPSVVRHNAEKRKLAGDKGEAAPMPEQDRRRGTEVLIALLAIATFGVAGFLLLLGEGWAWALPIAAALIALWTTRRAWIPAYRVKELEGRVRELEGDGEAGRNG